jgi:hypothetical protein
VSEPASNTFPLEDIAVPTLLVHAADDRLAPYEHVPVAAARIPNLHFVTIRAGDLIGWLLEYLQPTVEANRSWDRPPGLRLVADDAPVDVVAGEGESRAVLRASARDLLMFLWRRPTGQVSIEGDPRILHAYLDRVV